MTKWSYAMQGAPEGEPTNIRDMDEPGHVIMSERLREPGVCDLYILLGRNDTFRTATYEWKASGAPEELWEKMAEITGVDPR
jgi:hypothetical protein